MNVVDKIISVIDTVALTHELPELKLVERRQVADIPRRLPLVYILLHDDKPIVVGEGKSDRAKVIFDGPNQVTWGHLKSFIVRLHWLCGGGEFKRYTVTCQCKGDATKIESALHDAIGGDSNRIAPEYMDQITRGLTDDLKRLVRAASLSAYSGLRDLRVWYNYGIINESEWIVLCDRFKLPTTITSSLLDGCELHSA